MARKIQVKLILLLRSTGMSQRAICQSRHMSRSSVSEVFRIADEQNVTYADVESKSSAEVYSIAQEFFRKNLIHQLFQKSQYYRQFSSHHAESLVQLEPR